MRIAFAFLVLILVACSPEQSNPPESTTPTNPPASASTTSPPTVEPREPTDAACGQVIATTDPRGSSATSLAVFSSAQGLSVYNVAADSVELFRETNSPNGHRPGLRTPGLVSFVRQREPSDEGHLFGQDSLYELDLDGGQTTEILRLSNLLTRYDWNQDGTLLAYQLRTETPSRIGPRFLCLFDSRSGETSMLRSIERPFGTGTGQREETAVTWSPTGRFILAVETAAQPSLFVVDVDGRDVVAPRDGTFARWLSDERVVFQEDPHTDRLRPWVSLSTMTGRTRPFGLPNRAYRPAFSPGGDMVAFDDGDGDEPSIFVFDIEQGTSRMLARGYVAPVWLGPDLIAATAAGPCPSENFCPIPWSVLGTTVGIDPTTSEDRQLALPTTLQEVHRYGVIDVFMPR